MLTDIKFIKAKLTNIIQLDQFLRNLISKLGKKLLMKFCVPLAKDILSKVGQLCL